jgi:ribonuclease R
MEQLGEHTSMAERRADDATRDVMAWLKCEYLSDHVGEDYDGVIASVVPFGFFVELSGVYIEGLVHVSTLSGDFFHHDSAKHRLIGERTAMSFRLGDEVRVKVVRVGMEDRKIDLELISEPVHRQADRDALKVPDKGERGKGKRGPGKGGKPSGRGKPGQKGSSSGEAGPKRPRKRPASQKKKAGPEAFDDDETPSARDELVARAAKLALKKGEKGSGAGKGDKKAKPRKSGK